MKTSTLESLSAVAAVGSSPLEVRIRALGITPNDLKKIGAHKREQVKLHPPNMIGWALRTLGIPHDKAYGFSCWFPRIGAGAFAVGFFVFYALVLSFFAGLSDKFATTNWTAMIVLASIMATSFSVSVFFLLLLNKKAVYPAIWRLVPYNEAFQTAELSSSIIAQSVLNRHALIARNLVDIRFEIEELWQGSAKLDPIAWVVDVVTGERIAISVWDELGNEVFL